MLFQDVRYALRGLWHTKGFAVIAILCLGFGVGLNTTIFSIVDGVLLKPFPYDDPDRIVTSPVSITRSVDGVRAVAARSAGPDGRASKSFVAFGASQGRSLTLSDAGAEPERFAGAAVSWDLFPMLGVAPVLGHAFTAADDRPGAGGVVIISDAVWKTRYQLDPGVIGRTILVNADARGHRRRDAAGISSSPNSQKLWIPLEPVSANEPRASRNLLIVRRG